MQISFNLTVMRHLNREAERWTSAKPHPNMKRTSLRSGMLLLSLQEHFSRKAARLYSQTELPVHSEICYRAQRTHRHPQTERRTARRVPRRVYRWPERRAHTAGRCSLGERHDARFTAHEPCVWGLKRRQIASKHFTYTEGACRSECVRRELQAGINPPLILGFKEGQRWRTKVLERST